MRVLVTGSAGHLGEALMRTIPALGFDAVGLDCRPSPYTTVVGSITDRPLVADHLDGVDAVIHAATLHKPHIETHSRQDFVSTNVEGTLVMLEESARAGVGAFVLTSTTSTFGRALSPPAGAPAVWVTEDLVPVPRNIYGVTKVAAENLAELIHRDHGLPCVVLRTSRFFPEDDDQAEVRAAYSSENAKVNELLNRRVDIEDVVSAHVAAIARAATIGFGRYIVSATTPFAPEDLADLVVDAPALVTRRVPGWEDLYEDRGWTMPPSISRVYVNDRARVDLDWAPQWDFASAIERLRAGDAPVSDLAIAIGAKGYGNVPFASGRQPT